MARDGCVVDSQPLADLLVAWSRRRRQQHPHDAARPSDVLAEQTGIPVDTIRNIARVRPKWPTTGLDIADRLLCAIGYPDALDSGLFGPDPIRPNRAASERAQRECCGRTWRDLVA